MIAAAAAHTNESIGFDRETRLGEILIKIGKITQQQLETALNFQQLEREQEQSGQIGEFLIKHRCISREDLEEALRIQGNIKVKHGIHPDKSIRVVSVKDPELFQYVPKNMATDYCVFPIALKINSTKKVLYLAMSNIHDMEAINAIQFRLGCFVTPLPSTQKNILNSIDKFY